MFNNINGWSWLLRNSACAYSSSCCFAQDNTLTSWLSPVTGLFTIDYYLFFIAGYCKWLIATTDSLFLFQLERMHSRLNIYSASVSFSCWRCSSTSSSILSRRICVYSRNTWPHTMFNYNRSNKGSGRQNLIWTTHTPHLLDSISNE